MNNNKAIIVVGAGASVEAFRLAEALAKCEGVTFVGVDERLSVREQIIKDAEEARERYILKLIQSATESFDWPKLKHDIKRTGKGPLQTDRQHWKAQRRGKR